MKKMDPELLKKIGLGALAIGGFATAISFLLTAIAWGTELITGNPVNVSGLNRLPPLMQPFYEDNL